VGTWPASIDLPAHVRPGDHVVWNHGGAEPLSLIAQLLDQRHEIGGRFTVFFTGVGVSTLVQPLHADAIDFVGIGGLGSLGRLAKAGCLDVVPHRYSDMPALIAGGQRPVDVFLARVSEPDADGMVSLGATVAVAPECMAAARVRIAEVNPHVPYVGGDALVSLDAFDAVISSTTPLPETPPAKETPIAVRICEQIALLVDDGSTLQLGIGSIGTVLPRMLADRRHLGVHAGILTDGLMQLIESGTADGVKKEIDTGIAVAGELLGTAELYRYTHANPGVALQRSSVLLNPHTLSSFSRFVSVNGALQVDLTGQVNAESADGVPLGAIGGHVDFVSAGSHSEFGVSIVALPSTTPDGRSRIVPVLDAGVVTTARSEVDVVVTEYGVAHLRGLSLGERRRSLAAVAHPGHREGLSQAAQLIRRVPM
jgi:acetyl-CoA hydrolase